MISTPDLDWLKAFDKDDLISFLSELILAMEEPIETCYNNQEEIIYEWKQSSLAINDSEIQEAFKN